jgi:hypothetical protein
MKLNRIEFSPEATKAFRSLIDELLEESETVEDIILGAATRGDDISVSIFNVDNPGSPDPEIVCIQIDRTSEEKVELEIDLVELGHPDAVNIESFFRGHNEWGGIIFDDPALDKWEESLGFQRCKTLGSTIGSRSSLVPFIASFMKSGSAEIDISHYFFDDYEEYPEDEEALRREGFSRDRMVYVSASYQAKEKRNGIIPGFGTERHFYL